jgi:hypothetical protein
LKPLNGGDKNREAVPGILQPQLMASHAEGLAGRASHNHLGFWIGRFLCQYDLVALSLQIRPIGLASVRILLEADGGKTLRFKSKSQPAASCEKIKHEWFSNILGVKQCIDFIRVVQLGMSVSLE